MKRWMKIVAGVAVVLVVFLVVLNFFAGDILKGSINTAGPRVLGVPISVQSAQVGLLRGHIALHGLVIGNPEGFQTPQAIRVEHVEVSVKMATVLQKVLVIDRIRVEAPDITYEIRLNGSNISAIENKLSPASPTEAKPAPAKEGQKVEIDDLLIENGRIRVSSVGMAGNAMIIPLPPMHLTGIGKESNGASVREVVARVFGVLGGAVTGAAAGIGKGIGEVGGGAMDAGKAIGTGAGNMLKSAEGLFKK